MHVWMFSIFYWKRKTCLISYGYYFYAISFSKCIILFILQKYSTINQFNKYFTWMDVTLTTVKSFFSINFSHAVKCTNKFHLLVIRVIKLKVNSILPTLSAYQTTDLMHLTKQICFKYVGNHIYKEKMCFIILTFPNNKYGSQCCFKS